MKRAALGGLLAWSALAAPITLRAPQGGAPGAAKAETASAAEPEAPARAKEPDWLLQPFLSLGADDPQRLLRIAEGLFEPERLTQSLTDPDLAYEWQHRLAMLSALTAFFEPAAKIKDAAACRERASAVIKRAMANDPGLLVRDGAVEAIRRIVRMRPSESRAWQAPLETAFLSPENTLEGEGFFIKETILTALRDASLRPSARIFNAARADRNPQVRELLKLWQTNAYGTL